SRRRHTRFSRDWSSDVCSSDLPHQLALGVGRQLIVEPAQYAFFGTGVVVLHKGAGDRQPKPFKALAEFLLVIAFHEPAAIVFERSEERRVGKECRSRRTPYEGK